MNAIEFCKKLDNELGEIWSNDYKELPERMEEYAKLYHEQQLKILNIPVVNTRFPEKSELEKECTAYMESVIKETDYRDRPIHLKYAFKAGINYLNEFLNGC